MSRNVIGGGDVLAQRASANPWLIAVLVALASFMEVLDTTIANVALPYIAGGMGVSQDESSWVVTTYLVSNAIILTASSFLAKRLGRKRFFLLCLGLFTLSSVLCGFAWNLQALLLFRMLQGIGGGAWSRSRNRSSRIPFLRKSAARRLHFSVWPWWWRRSSGRRSAAGCPTTSPGTGAF
jgi:MFS family permease